MKTENCLIRERVKHNQRKQFKSWKQCEDIEINLKAGYHKNSHTISYFCTSALSAPFNELRF